MIPKISSIARQSVLPASYAKKQPCFSSETSKNIERNSMKDEFKTSSKEEKKAPSWINVLTSLISSLVILDLIFTFQADKRLGLETKNLEEDLKQADELLETLKKNEKEIKEYIKKRENELKELKKGSNLSKNIKKVK